MLTQQNVFSMGDVMLLFGNSEKRDPVRVAQIRAWVAELLPVPEDAFVMVKQMECPEEGCPPVETIIAILCNHAGPKQWKLPKPMRRNTMVPLPNRVHAVEPFITSILAARAAVWKTVPRAAP